MYGVSLSLSLCLSLGSSKSVKFFWIASDIIMTNITFIMNFIPIKLYIVHYVHCRKSVHEVTNKMY